MNEATVVLLVVVTVSASIVQVTTGIGFGIVAAPFYLLAFSAAQAIQITTLVTLGSISPALPRARRTLAPRVFVNLAAGSIVGFPTGLIVLPLLSETTIRAVVAILLAIASVLVLLRFERHEDLGTHPRGWRAHCAALACGAAASVSAIAVGMPGPVLVAYLLLCGFDVEPLRGTSIALIALFSATAVVGHQLGPGIHGSTVLKSILLLPAALAGSAIGNYLSDRLASGIRRHMVVAVLITSVGALAAPLAT